VSVAIADADSLTHSESFADAQAVLVVQDVPVVAVVPEDFG
jgi:hypothetical protein